MALAELKLGNLVAICDTDDPEDKHFHVAKVLRIDADTQTAMVQQYATKTASIRAVVWQPLFAWTRRDPQDASRQVHTYGLGGTTCGKYKPVEDTVELEDPTDEFPYIRHCDLKLLASGKLAAASRHQLADKKLRHHQLGRTYH